MSGKNIIFDDEKIKKSSFNKKKNKNLFNIFHIAVSKILILISKKEPYVKKANLNTLLDIIRMIPLDHYV